MLPKIEHPLYEMIVPSTKAKVMVRPMLVKEEKILLMAKEGDDYGEKMLAIKQVLTNCCQNLNVDTLTIFDIEYLFLKLRALSVDNKITLRITDEGDEKERTFDIDLNEVEVDFSGVESNVIDLGKQTGLTLRYPTAKIYENTKNLKDEQALTDMLVASALDTYFDGDKVYDLKKETPQNLTKFLDEQVTANVYYKIREYLQNMPSLKHEIKYTNDEGKDVAITLSSLNDFFMF